MDSTMADDDAICVRQMAYQPCTCTTYIIDVHAVALIIQMTIIDIQIYFSLKFLNSFDF